MLSEASYACSRSDLLTSLKGAIRLQGVLSSGSRRRGRTQQGYVSLIPEFVLSIERHGVVEEHAEVKRLVHSADTKNFGSADYNDILARAFHAFDTHAKEEEEQQFSQLLAKINPQENDVRTLIIFLRA